jgi:hypothetical protein
MAKRLRMTSADYVAIAISPALIMTLVGSLIFFLIAVFYEGEYQLRLTYAFAWFVFAAVLIARIAIEMGSERAAMFALPLAGAMYLFLVKFVEHPSPFSHLINLALMAAVWWCAHRLTWDSTVIDDDEDASGEGLMQRIGVDGPEAGGAEKKPSQLAGIGASENELLESADGDGSVGWKKLRRFVWPGKGRHTPGQVDLVFFAGGAAAVWHGAILDTRDGYVAAALRILFAAGVRGIGAVALGDDKLFESAAVFASAARGDAAPDCGHMGRRWRGFDRDCHAARDGYSATGSGSSSFTPAVAGEFARRIVRVAVGVQSGRR